MIGQAIKRPYIWLKRFRHRCGYGVHSPFAFDLITSVIYEKTSYYGYNEIETSELYKTGKKQERHVSKKTNRLLFRLVNRFQPAHIYQMGEPSVASMYLQKGCKRGEFIPNAEDSFYDNIDFIYIPFYPDAPEWHLITIRLLIAQATSQSVYVLGGIGYTREMKELWNDIKENDKVGVTFDLYDAGIIFFDTKRTKQHYIVNF